MTARSPFTTPTLFVLAVITFAALYTFLTPSSPVTGHAATDAIINLTIEVTPAGETQGNRGGALGGGTQPKRTREGILIDYDYDPRSFSITTTPGTGEERHLRLVNHQPLTLDVDLSTTLDILYLDGAHMSIPPQQDRTVAFTVTAPQPGLYTGKIHLATPFGDSDIPVIVSAASPAPPFTLATTLPDAFTRVPPHATILLKLALTDLDGGFIDIQYVIKDAKNTDIYTLTEILPVKTSLSIDKTIQLPPTLTPGTYVLGVIVHYKGATRVDTTFFRVTTGTTPRTETPQPTRDYSLILFITIIALLATLYAKHRTSSHL